MTLLLLVNLGLAGGSGSLAVAAVADLIVRIPADDLVVRIPS